LPTAPKQLCSQNSPDLKIGPAVNGSLAEDVAFNRWDSKKKETIKSTNTPNICGQQK